MTVIGVERSKTLGLFRARDDEEYIRVTIKVTNLGPADSEITIDDNQFSVRGFDVCSFCFSGNGNPFIIGPTSNSFHDRVIKGGNSSIGNFTTAIGEDARDMRLEFGPSFDEPAEMFLSLE